MIRTYLDPESHAFLPIHSSVITISLNLSRQRALSKTYQLWLRRGLGEWPSCHKFWKDINTQACFIEKESQKYIPLVTCAHEIAQVSARLAEEAREIEKSNDTVMRKPHSKSGKIKIKTKLMLSPVYAEEFEKSLDE